jgi:phage-related tail fiber protein
MKKFVSIALALVLALSLAVVAFAAPGAFIESPSKKSAPTLVEFKVGSANCTAKIVITGYADRATLADDVRAALEAAYATIKGTKDVTTLNADLASLAASKNIKTTSLAVSELFDISVADCAAHADHKGMQITISPESVVGFVGILHYENGAWTFVSGAAVDGENVKFTVDTLSPFAIVVNTEELENPNATGDTLTYVLIAVAVLSAAGLVIVAVSSKRKRI